MFTILKTVCGGLKIVVVEPPADNDHVIHVSARPTEDGVRVVGRFVAGQAGRLEAEELHVLLHGFAAHCEQYVLGCKCN